MRVYAVHKEQPQFFVPLTFASFKDHVVAPKAPQELPRTPSPQAYHREIPCAAERNAGYCTEQALQQAFQNQNQKESLCPPMPYDQCMQQLMPNQECIVQNTNPNNNMFMADLILGNDINNQGSWVHDPCMKISAPPCNVPASPCNVGYMNQGPPQAAPSAAPTGFMNQGPPPAAPSAAPAGWQYCWDAQGNMHMWPENSQQGSSAPTTRCCYDSAGNMHVWPETPQSGSYVEGSMIDLSPKAAHYNIPAPYCSGTPNNKLRSDTMDSWGSSTTSPSTASHKYSSAESLRSESLHSSSGQSWADITEEEELNTGPSDATSSRQEQHMPRPKGGFLGLVKEKFKSKPKVIAPPRRFVNTSGNEITLM
jgi:hypothetical protein